MEIGPRDVDSTTTTSEDSQPWEKKGPAKKGCDHGAGAVLLAQEKGGGGEGPGLPSCAGPAGSRPPDNNQLGPAHNTGSSPTKDRFKDDPETLAAPDMTRSEPSRDGQGAMPGGGAGMHGL